MVVFFYFPIFFFLWRVVVRNLACPPLLSEGRGCEKPLGKQGLRGGRDGQRGGGRGEFWGVERWDEAVQGGTEPGLC